ncbi:hypothetical protein DFH11DRAFT_578148 [Phellopilus nigrolimitatus]|nr:hypothetical protein DFH11DRAFT_578148 [Phellopilus nigrolimitatus]
MRAPLRDRNTDSGCIFFLLFCSIRYAPTARSPSAARRGARASCHTNSCAEYKIQKIQRSTPAADPRHAETPASIASARRLPRHSDRRRAAWRRLVTQRETNTGLK